MEYNVLFMRKRDKAGNIFGFQNRMDISWITNTQILQDDDEDFAEAATADISDYSTVDINDGNQQPVLLYIDTEHNIISVLKLYG